MSYPEYADHDPRAPQDHIIDEAKRVELLAALLLSIEEDPRESTLKHARIERRRAIRVGNTTWIDKDQRT